jgi:hypothetical protein
MADLRVYRQLNLLNEKALAVALLTSGFLIGSDVAGPVTQRGFTGSRLRDIIDGWHRSASM